MSSLGTSYPDQRGRTAYRSRIRSRVPQALLRDNVSEQRELMRQLNYIDSEKKRVGLTFDRNKNSYLHRQLERQREKEKLFSTTKKSVVLPKIQGGTRTPPKLDVVGQSAGHVDILVINTPEEGAIDHTLVSVEVSSGPKVKDSVPDVDVSWKSTPGISARRHTMAVIETRPRRDRRNTMIGPTPVADIIHEEVTVSQDTSCQKGPQSATLQEQEVPRVPGAIMDMSHDTPSGRRLCASVSSITSQRPIGDERFRNLELALIPKEGVTKKLTRLNSVVDTATPAVVDSGQRKSSASQGPRFKRLAAANNLKQVGSTIQVANIFAASRSKYHESTEINWPTAEYNK